MKSKKGKNKERLALKYQYQCVLEAGAEVTQHLNGKYIKTHEIEIMSQK
jgi:glycyl-tRNA synthetase alpha subunit